jgi:phosphohistidine phosphatase
MKEEIRDAPMMGKRLLTRNFNIDLIVSSSAKRAAQTAKLIAQEINYPSKHIHWQDKLYHAPPSVIQEVIFETSNSINTLMIVCHNPGITDFINAQCGIITTNVPTCGMAAFRYDTPSWSNTQLLLANCFFMTFLKMGFSFSSSTL